MATGRIGVTPTLRTRWSKAPAGGTTSLSGLDDNSVSLVYDVGYEAVYRNGVLLSRTNDYTATTGNSITLIDATIAGDIIEVFANQLLPLTNAIGNGQYTAKGALLSATAASTPAVLAVGSNDQVLTADSSTATGLKWATAGGMTLLSTNSLSGATTHTISGISGDYKHLFFLGKMFKTAGNNEAISIRFNSDSGNNYYGVIWRSVNTTLTPEVLDGASSLLSIISTQDNDTVSQRAQFAINLYRYTDTDNVSGVWTSRGSSNTGRVQTHGYFTYDNSAAVDSISLVSSGPNITGTLYVYGVK